jgi:protein-S-isoprenylcysteine O-methyltransferase Ste14
MFMGDRLAGGFRMADRGATRISRVLQTCVTVLVVAVVFGLMLMFSVVVFAAVLTLGSIGWGYLWWKSRMPHRQPQRHKNGPPPNGLVLEGEVIREVREHDDRSR